MRIYKEYLFASHYATKSENQNKEGDDAKGLSDIIQWAEARAGDKARANANASRSHEAAFNLLIMMIDAKDDREQLNTLISELSTLPY